MPRISEIKLPDALVAAARAGDSAALEAVHAATAGALYTLLRRLVRRPAIAEELLQETFVDVLEHIGAYEGRCPLPAARTGCRPRCSNPMLRWTPAWNGP